MQKIVRKKGRALFNTLVCCNIQNKLYMYKENFDF